MRPPRISIIVPAHNEERTMAACLEALFAQSFPDFELIVVDDGSTDGTNKVVASFRDPRLVLITNASKSGIARSRNLALAEARGDLVFFSDADCVADHDWLRNGLARFQPGTLALSGTTHYVSPGFQPSLRDRVLKTRLSAGRMAFDAGHRYALSTFMCCNAAYRRSVLARVGGFNEAYGSSMEDFDLYLRVLESVRPGSGEELASCPEMVVCHQRELFTVRSVLRTSFYENIVRIKHDHSYRNPLVFLGPVVYPTFLALALCPPLLWPYLRLHGQGISGPGDLPFLPLLYLRFVLIRLAIWKNALSLGVAAV